MSKIARKLLVGFLAGLLTSGAWMAPRYAQAANPSSGATVVDRTMTRDSGGSVLTDEARGYKVHEVFNSATAQLVVDEDGTAPTAGVLKKVCVSSGSATTEYAVVYDSASITGITATTSGKALHPLLNRATATERCLDINAQFHRGLVVIQDSAVGRTYVYWRKLSGRH